MQYLRGFLFLVSASGESTDVNMEDNDDDEQKETTLPTPSSTKTGILTSTESISVPDLTVPTFLSPTLNQQKKPKINSPR